MIVLVGFMGAGKSTVGPLLAMRLGLPFVDTDAEIERRGGGTVAQIFQEHGEPGFRALERETVAWALESDDAVISLGGGALDDPAARASLEWATVVHLDVAFTEALNRIDDPALRPMLAKTDPKALYDDRRSVYRNIADHSVDTTGKAPAEVIDELVGLLGDRVTSPAGSRRIRVGIPGAPYEMVVGAGLLEKAGELIPLPAGAERAAVITHPTLQHFANRVVASLGQKGLQSSTFEIAEGETSKDLATVQRLYDGLAAAGIHRNDLVVGVGGGVVCDVAGFVASTYNRGVAVAHVPTTLLAQVDAAIGGKTAVNLGAGKNLVGTFHQPRAVIADVAVLRELPEAELRSGLAEVIKHGLIADPGLLDMVAERSLELFAGDEAVLEEVVARAAAVKAAIVTADERERDRRAVLNYGHTFGHAIEHVGSIRHGEAVALGMMAAAYAAAELGLIGEDVVDTHRRVLAAVGLPTAATMDIEELEPVWQRDKKYDRGVRFVLLEGIGRPRMGVEIPRDVLERVVKRLGS